MASAMAIASAVIEHRGCPSEAEGRAELHATWYRRNRGVLENRHLQLKNRPSDIGTVRFNLARLGLVSWVVGQFFLGSGSV